MTIEQGNSTYLKEPLSFGKKPLHLIDRKSADRPYVWIYNDDADVHVQDYLRLESQKNHLTSPREMV